MRRAAELLSTFTKPWSQCPCTSVVSAELHISSRHEGNTICVWLILVINLRIVLQCSCSLREPLASPLYISLRLIGLPWDGFSMGTGRVAHAAEGFFQRLHGRNQTSCAWHDFEFLIMAASHFWAERASLEPHHNLSCLPFMPTFSGRSCAISRYLRVLRKSPDVHLGR